MLKSLFGHCCTSPWLVVFLLTCLASRGSRYSQDVHAKAFMLLDLLCQVASDPGQHLLLEDCSVEVTVKCGHIELVHSGGPDLLGLIKKTLEGLTNTIGWSQSKGGQPHPNTCAAWLWASSHLLKMPLGVRGGRAGIPKHH